MTISNIELCLRLKRLNYQGESQYLLLEDFEGQHGYMTRRDYEHAQGIWTPIASAPYLEEVVEWLREKHDLHISTMYRHTMSKINRPWTYKIQIIGSYSIYAGHDYYMLYEETLENAIQHALDIIEEKNV